MQSRWDSFAWHVCITLPPAACPLPPAACPLPTAYCPLPTAYCLLTRRIIAPQRPPTKPELKFTYDDYLLLPEDKRYELVDGDLYMVPAPRIFHQIVSLRIVVALNDHVEKKLLGQVIAAPCDVYLSRYDVVQPDILWICSDRLGIMKEAYVDGAPDLVVEILSPSDPERDRELKRKLYARFGVREYWIVDPSAKGVEVLTRQEGDLKTVQVFVADDNLSSPLLQEFELSLSNIFKT